MRAFGTQEPLGLSLLSLVLHPFEKVRVRAVDAARPLVLLPNGLERGLDRNHLGPGPGHPLDITILLGRPVFRQRTPEVPKIVWWTDRLADRAIRFGWATRFRCR